MEPHGYASSEYSSAGFIFCYGLSRPVALDDLHYGTSGPISRSRSDPLVTCFRRHHRTPHDTTAIYTLRSQGMWIQFTEEFLTSAQVPLLESINT